MFPRALLSALYISVYRHRVQVTVVNLRLWTSETSAELLESMGS